MNWGKKPTSAEFQQRYNNTAPHQLSVPHTFVLFNKNIFGCFCVFSCVRVELQKRKVLEQCEMEQGVIYEELRRKKVVQDRDMEMSKAQLLVSMFPAIWPFHLNDKFMG